MNGWIVFWGILIIFSLVSFTYMSGKILVKGFSELKEMLHELERKISK